MNRFREEIEEEEVGPEPELKAAPKRPKTAEEKMDSNSFISKLLNDRVVSKEAATDALPYL